MPSHSHRSSSSAALMAVFFTSGVTFRSLNMATRIGTAVTDKLSPMDRANHVKWDELPSNSGLVWAMNSALSVLSRNVSENPRTLMMIKRRSAW